MASGRTVCAGEPCSLDLEPELSGRIVRLGTGRTEVQELAGSVVLSGRQGHCHLLETNDRRVPGRPLRSSRGLVVIAPEAQKVNLEGLPTLVDDGRRRSGRAMGAGQDGGTPIELTFGSPQKRQSEVSDPRSAACVDSPRRGAFLHGGRGRLGAVRPSLGPPG